MDKISTTYKENTITLVNDEWQLEGREYANASLVKVKEYIDRQIKAEFTPVEAYYAQYSELRKARLTSHPDERTYWGTIGGSRTKMDVRNLRVMNDANDAIFAKHQALKADISRLSDQIQVLRKEQELLVEKMEKFD